METWGNWYWPIYLLTATLALLIPEIIALIAAVRTHLDNTLSNWTWKTEPPTYTWEWYVSLILWVGVAVWLTGHIWWKIWG